MTPSQKAEALIRHYFDMCNLADRDGLIRCFTPDATHYFPPGLPDTPWRGAERIADGWVWAVNTMGSKWTIDKIITTQDGKEAVIEWTHWKTGIDEVLHGDEWYIFNEDVTKIVEIRAYYASPVNKAEKENKLSGFDYEGRGYHMKPPHVDGRDE